MFFKLKVNFLSRLWLCPPRSCRTSFPQLSRPLCSDEKSQIKDEVLSRVQVVDDLKASAKIVDDLVERGQPVGVDMEGLNAGQVGMVQVKAPDNKIYIFRPTIHPRIWSQGKLKNLFEAHQVLKVFHAATMDLIATNRNGVKLWSLYDTALAEKIINYQRHGTSTTAETLSFQSMCAKYGVFVNPVKDNYSGRKWNTIAWHNQESLNEDLLFYSACDVEPLLDLYQITKSLLDPEFLPLLRELHEIELLRSIEPRITEMKKKMRGKIEGSSVFVSGLHESVSPANLYEALCHIFEMRKITFSPNNRTAHLHFENRGDAVAAFHEISTERERYQHWGVDLNASLVKSLLPNELVAVKGEKNLLLDSLRDDSLIEDSAVMSKLVDKLVYSRCPIVCNFNPPNREKSALILEVYTGRHPVIKFILDGDSALKGKLGALLESEVPKVVKRTDTSNVYEAVKICYEAGFVCKNIFGISDGFKIVPYMRAGQSFFKESPHSIQAAAEVLGIDNVTGKKSMDTQLLIYQYLVDTLPSKMLEFWADKCHADLLIGTNTEIPKGKLNRKVLKEKYETYSFHVTCVKGSAERLKSVLEAYLDKNNMTYNHIIVSGQHALVSMHRRNPILREIVSNLNNETDVNGLKLRAKEIKLQPNLNIQNLFDPINEEKLRMKMASHVAKLNGLGVFDGILEPVSDSKRTEFDLANRNLDQYRSLTR